MWVAERCRTAPLPMGWAEHTTEDGQAYYHHTVKKETVRRAPARQLALSAPVM
jgi:hypothetical protein